MEKAKPHPHFKKYRPQAKRKAAIAAWYSRFDSGAIWNDKGAVSLRKPEKEKNGCSIPFGKEHPFALLYNLIATKNLQESEIIIQQ